MTVIFVSPCSWLLGTTLTYKDFALLPRKSQLVADLLEGIDIRGSIHDGAQIKSSFSLSLLLDFVVITERVACPPQNAFSKLILCYLWTTWKATRKFSCCITL